MDVIGSEEVLEANTASGWCEACGGYIKHHGKRGGGVHDWDGNVMGSKRDQTQRTLISGPSDL